MVLLVNIVCEFIFCVIFLFSNGVAEKEPKNGMCSKRVCQEASNPFDITRNDAMNGLKDSNNHETNAGDMFRDISGNPNIKKVSEVHDNGFYTSLCWIEITTITEINNGSKSAIREYAITFETPSDIPDKYIKKNSDNIDGETIQYKIFDRDTRKSEVVNFTTISRSKESIVRQNRKVLCGSGPVYTKTFMEWPHSDRKRVEIRVSPKRQNLVASDCIVLNANVENISTLSPTRRDFDGGSGELPTREGLEGITTLKYPTPESLVNITPKDINYNIKKYLQTDKYVENTETTIQRISSSQSTHQPLLPENTTPKIETQTLKSDEFKQKNSFWPLTKLPKQPMHLKKPDFNLTRTPLLKPPTNENTQSEFITRESTSTEYKDYEHLEVTKNLASENAPHTSVTRFQPKVTIKKATTKIINEEGDNSTVIIGSQTTNTDSQTEHYLDSHFTKLASNMEDTSFANKEVPQVLEYGGGTEVKNVEFTAEPPKLPAIITDRISSTTASEKYHHVEAEDSKLKNTQKLIEQSKKPTFNPDVTPDKYQVTEGSDSSASTYWKQLNKHTAVAEKYNKQFTPENKYKLVLSTTSQVPQKSSLLPAKIQDLPNTESKVVERTTNSNYEVNYASTKTNVIVNKTAEPFKIPNESASLESITKHPNSINYSEVNSFVTHGFIGSELTSPSEYDNPITTQKSIITNKASKTTASSLSADVTFNTVNTPITKRLRSESLLKFVTRPAMKPYTKILKNIDKSILKENNGQGESDESRLKFVTRPAMKPYTKILKNINKSILKENNGQSESNETHVKSSTTERIEPISTVDVIKENQYEDKTSRTDTNGDLDEATYTRIESDTNYSPIDNYFTGDVLGSSLESTTKYEVEPGQTFKMVSQLPHIEKVSASEGLLDPAQQITKDFEDLKPALFQVKPSQRPVHSNSNNDKISSVSLSDQSKYTTANDLPTGPVVQKVADLLQKHITVSESLADQEEHTEKDLEISKPGHILTQLPFTLIREPTNKNYVFESTATSSSLQPVQTTKIFFHLPDKYTTETLLDRTQIKNRVSEIAGNLRKQPKAITGQPSRLRDITDSLSDLSHKDTTARTTVSDNLLDEMGDTKTDTIISNSAITNADFESVYDGKSSSDIESDSLIHPFKSTSKQSVSMSTAVTISLSNVGDETYAREKNVKIPEHIKMIMPPNEIHSPLHYSESTTEHVKPKQNTYSVKTQGTTPENKADKPSTTLLNEMQTSKMDLEAPNRWKIKITTTDETALPTDTHSTTSVRVLDNLSNQSESTTEIRESVLNDTQSTKESVEKPTRKQTIISSEPLFSYTVAAETTTEYSTSLSNNFSLKPEKNRDSVNLQFTSSEIPITGDYISLKPAHKPYSNVPNMYSNHAYFAGRFTSTGGTISDSGTTAEKLLLGSRQSTTKSIDLEQTLNSKLPLKPHHTTSAEGFTFEKLLDEYKNPPKYVPLPKKPYFDASLEYPNGMSSVIDFPSSERSLDEFHSSTRHTKAKPTGQSPIFHKHIKATSSTRGFTSSEILLDNYQSTIKDTQLKQKASTKLPIKYSSDTSPEEEVITASDLVQATTQRIKPQRKTSSVASVTATKSLLPHSFKSTRQPPQYHLKSKQFQSVTDNNNLAQKPNSQGPLNHPSDAYFTTDFTSPARLTETFRITTENVKTGHQSYSKTGFTHPSDRYSTGGLTSSAALLDEPEKSSREEYLTNAFTTSLNYPQTTITKVFPLSSVVYPYAQYKKNRTVPLENSNKFEDTDKNVTNYNHSIPANTESSTNKLTHILKSLHKSLCNNTKQKILVRVKILMEHILEENDSGTITKQVIPIIGVEKNTEFDIKPKNMLPIVPQKKLNEDWNIFLDNLAKNFFDFNRHAVQNYTELKSKNLNLNIPGYEFGGDILSPRESIQRMQRIRNSLNRCKNKHGNKASREPKLTVDQKTLPFRTKHAVDNDNEQNSLKLTTQSEENLTPNFYRFLLGTPSRNAELEVDNKTVKVEIPTKLVLPFNEHSKMNVFKVLNDWQGKPNIALRNIEYMTPIPGSYRGGYKQFSLSDLFPISSKSKIGQYVPTIVYHTAPKIVPEIFRPYSAIKDYDMHNVLASHNSQRSIDIGPRIEEYGKSKNSQYETSITSSSTNGGVDFATATVKTFKHKETVNDNLMKIRTKHVNATNTVHINEESFSALPKLSNNVTTETSNFSNEISHNSIVDDNLYNSGYQTSGRVNLNPITENYKSEYSTPHKLIDFKSILDGIINKLNAVLEKLSNR